MNLKVLSTLPWLAALVMVVNSYGYKFTRRPGAADCRLQLNLPGYPPSYHEDYTQDRYSNQFTQAERNKQQNLVQQGSYNPGDMIECRRGEVYSIRLNKCVRNAQGTGGNYGSTGGFSTSSGSYGGSAGQGSYGGSSVASGNYGGSSGIQSGSYGGSSGVQSGSYGGSKQTGSYGGSSGVQSGSYGGSKQTGSYGGSSAVQSGSYGGSKQSGNYGGVSGSGNYGGSGGNYGSSSNFGSSSSSGNRRPTGLINSGNKGFASTNIAASYRPTDDQRYGSGENFGSQTSFSQSSQQNNNNGYPAEEADNGFGSNYEESYGSSSGVVAPTFEEDRYAGSSGGVNYEEETSYGGRPAASSSANIGGGVYEEQTFSSGENYPSYGTGGAGGFNTDNRRKYGSPSVTLGASAFSENFGSAATSGPGGVTAVVTSNLRPQGDRVGSFGGGSYPGGGSSVVSESSFESSNDDEYNNNRGVNSRPINVGPSYTTGGSDGGGSFTSEKKKYSFASSTANKKEEEESTFIASGPPLETESGAFSTSSSSSDPGVFYDLKFASDALEAHNRYREIHGAVPLVLDPKLSEAAQIVAEKFASGQETFRHSDEAIAGRVGENIAVRTGVSAKAAASAIDFWYKENVNYDWDNPRLVTRPENLSNHRFTALVWNSSRKLGIGKAIGKDGRTYIVAQYFPAGNIVSRLEQNVFPPKRFTSNDVSSRASY